ncbi:MAG: ABC transporter substrate-binding protein [Pseudomonadota bacterium]
MKLLRIILTIALLLPTLNASAAPFTYKDKMGRTVTIQTPVKRAVLYETYELLPVTGAWSQVAGISRYGHENDLLLAIKPDIRKIPDAGSAMDTNAEALLKLKPDVVLTWTVDPQVVRFLEKKGLTVIAVYPESIPELYEVMRMQGKLFGKEKKIETAIVKMDEMFDLIRKRTATIPPANRKKALYLTGKQTRVNGRIGVTQDLFTMMGIENAAQELGERSADVSLEKIISWNPDLVYIWGSARYSAADLIKNPQWRHIRAIKSGEVYKAPKWGTWSPRLAPITLWMAAKAYPERFRDIDVTKTIDKFYRDVYGIPYAKVTQIER